MPRRKARPRGRREPLSPALRSLLETGEPALAGGLALFRLASDARCGTPSPSLRDVWAEHGPDVLDAWVREYPGTRPAAWWVAAAEEPRRVLVDGAAVESDARAFGWWERAWRRAYGVPPFIDLPSGAMVESQASYLLRLGLLEPGEKRRIRRAAFAPEAVPFNDGEERR